MRAFSSFLICAFFALSANAVTIDKRAISAPVQLCINDIAYMSDQASVVKSGIDSFTRSQGYSGAAALHAKDLELGKRLKQAGVNCCVTPPTTFTVEETDAVLAAVGINTPKFAGVLNSYVAKKPEFDALPIWTGIVRQDIEVLNNQTIVLNTCLRTKIPIDPPNYLQTANGYLTQVENSLAAAVAAYAKNTTTTA